MSGIILDTSVYVDAIRRSDLSLLSSRLFEWRGKSLFVTLSCVVLAELYAGADDLTRKPLAKLEYDFSKSNRLIAPSKNDWVLAGKILNSIGTKYGFEMIGRSRMINDCLIAMTTRRRGLNLLTKNTGDFRIISEFRPFKFEEV